MSTRQQSASGSAARLQRALPQLAALLLVLFLSGCGGGGGDNLSIASFGGNPGSGCDNTVQNQSCTPPGGSDTSSATTVIDENSYQFVALRVTSQLDSLLRHRSGTPPTLADLAARLLQKVDQNSTHVCDGDMVNADPIVIDNTNGFTLTITNCLMADPSGSSTVFPLDGTVNVSNFAADNSTSPVTVSADLTISLTYTYQSTGDTLSFDGNLGFSTQISNNDLVSTLDVSNLRITEQPAGSTSIIDTFTSGTLTNSTNMTNQQRTLNVNASYDNTSVTQATLDITASSLTWLLGSSNPDSSAGGNLQVTDSGGAYLTMTPVSATTMDISLNSGSPVCIRWTDDFPSGCA